LDESWKEVTLTFRHLTLWREECAPYSYRGLVEFLLRAERYVDHLGFTSYQRNAATVQLVQTELIQLALSQRLPTTVIERSQLEFHQMRCLFAERPQAEHHKRVAVMSVCWMDAYGMHYPRGWHATTLMMKELVDKMSNIEYTPAPVL